VTAEPHVDVDDLVLHGRVRLEDLVDREGLDELCQTFVTLFGIPVRIYSSEGSLLGGVAGEQDLCSYVNTTPQGRKACGAIVGAVKAREPDGTGDVVTQCFTGAAYRTLALEYDGRRVGRLIVGPFLPTPLADVPPALLAADPTIARERAWALLGKMPLAKGETITRIAAHFKAALDLILFSGHKALITNKMHLASVRESYRQLEEKTARLQEAFDRLKELDRLKSNFLATVSHELRTPLTSIIGYSEMLAEGLAGEMNPEQRSFVKTIHEKGGQLLSLIMGLLELSKLESGTMRMAMRTVRIDPILNDVVATLAPTARKRSIKLDLDMTPALPDLRGDPERLRQVFLNLVENATKFTPEGGSVTLLARSVEEDLGASDEAGLALLAPTRARVEVRVIDTGIGIAPAERPKVFDPFYQVDSSTTREYGGAGLGLSIVKRLVEAHGGSIRIEENRPRGTAFVVTLPQAPVPGSDASAAT
jgi:signal transduction histidine kinase